MTAKLPKGHVRDVSGRFEKVQVDDHVMVTSSSSGRENLTGKVVEVYDNGTVKAFFGKDRGVRSYRAGSYRVIRKGHS